MLPDTNATSSFLGVATNEPSTLPTKRPPVQATVVGEEVEFNHIGISFNRGAKEQQRKNSRPYNLRETTRAPSRLAESAQFSGFTATLPSPTTPALKHFNCTYCKRSYLRKSRLNAHLKSHETDETACKVCNKTLADPTSLKNHLLTHANNRKKLHCTVAGCRYEFFTAVGLKSHMNRKHRAKGTKKPLLRKKSSSRSLSNDVTNLARSFPCTNSESATSNGLQILKEVYGDQGDDESESFQEPLLVSANHEAGSSSVVQQEPPAAELGQGSNPASPSTKQDIDAQAIQTSVMELETNKNDPIFEEESFGMATMSKLLGSKRMPDPTPDANPHGEYRGTNVTPVQPSGTAAQVEKDVAEGSGSSKANHESATQPSTVPSPVQIGEPTSNIAQTCSTSSRTHEQDFGIPSKAGPPPAKQQKPHPRRSPPASAALPARSPSLESRAPVALLNEYLRHMEHSLRFIRSRFIPGLEIQPRPIPGPTVPLHGEVIDLVSDESDEGH